MRRRAPWPRLRGGARLREAGRALRGTEGNALIEFVVLAVALLIPTLYLVLTLGSVQAAVFAADVIARDAARIHATETDPVAASGRSSAHARMVLEDFGLEPGDVVEIRCTEDPCATPGGTVTASVRIPVPIPGLGPVLGGAGPVAVSSEHIAPVDRYRAPGSNGPEGAA
ncbi:hypothetical protein [Brachybacterium phenoliresistens]|uniref:Pilus assembly protein TadE n=1 Tax=Brachybacterium phenoliresistens TaxID=396014 RepID=Z9JST5_9MICO|nr:hypothetical protein [Brachybacterium phenoliresistens]EWS80827.1 hypothetical protein BF93_01750 [Brachybacterium phenoliresistens]